MTIVESREAWSQRRLPQSAAIKRANSLAGQADV